jgi:hypothetical protein
MCIEWFGLHFIVEMRCYLERNAEVSGCVSFLETRINIFYLFAYYS